MKKKIQEFREKALPNLDKITGGGGGSPIDRDKLKFPKNGRRD